VRGRRRKVLHGHINAAVNGRAALSGIEEAWTDFYNMMENENGIV